MSDRSVVLILTGVVEGHFLLDHAAVVFQLSAQLCLVFPQLLLTTDTGSNKSRMCAARSVLTAVYLDVSIRYHSSVLCRQSLASRSRDWTLIYKRRDMNWHRW